MKIKSIKTRIVTTEAQRGVEFAGGFYSKYSCALVQIETDEGLVGYGESIARRGSEYATKQAVDSLLGPLLIGKDPSNIRGLWVEMVSLLRRWGHSRGIIFEAISGIDIALWDLLGKSENKPVWELLHGTGRKEILCYASSVYINDYEVMQKETIEQMEKGFRSIKVKIGRTPELGGITADVESVKKIREVIPNNIAITLDANSAYDAATAIQIARALEPYNISWFEEPVPPDDLTGYDRIHKMTSIPIAAGESEFSPFGFSNLITNRLIDVVQPDVARCGGITGMCQVADLAYTYNLQFAPHTGFSGGISALASLNVAASVPILTTYEYMFIDNPLRHIFEGGFPEPVNGKLIVPTKPGLGLTIDEKYFEYDLKI